MDGVLAMVGGSIIGIVFRNTVENLSVPIEDVSY